MNDLQLFKFENKRIRSLCIDGEPWFVGKDVAKTLGYSNLNDALTRHVDDEDKKGPQFRATLEEPKK